MNDIEKAKKLLSEGNYTCVLCKGEKEYVSELNGIRPMVGFIESKTDLTGFSAADKIIGKAGAMLMKLVGVKEVYASVMSKPATEVFEKYGIKYSYGEIVDNIINRTGDGICPMEQATADAQTPEEAYEKVKNKLIQLRGGKS